MQAIDTAPLQQFPQRIRLRWQRRVLHFKVPATTSRGALRERVTYIIEAEGETGTGHGECCVMPGLLPEIDEAELQRWCRATEESQSLRIENAPSPINFGIETAVLSALRGGNPRWDTPFSRGEAGIPIHCLIWMADAATMLQKIQQGMQQGFTCIKMKVGALPFAEELQLLREVRAAYPQVEIRVDANGAFAPAEALRKCEALAALNISYIEQPLAPGQHQLMADLCRHSTLPIALDEELIHSHVPEQLLDAVMPQAIVIKPSLHGGLLAAEQWARAAEARGIAWWVNSALESRVGLCALAEWCAYVAPGRMQGLGTGRLFTDDAPGRVSLQGAQLRFN